jgi:uncharacterized membrane protein (DUF4010 family)
LQDVDLRIVIRLLVAVLGGAAIGLERQWSGHASGPHARFGGIRTFTLLGTLAGLAGWLSDGRLLPVAVVLLAAASGMVLVSYAAASRHDIDATTEVAALVVLAAGTLAGAGHVVLASGIAAATALLLLEKTRLHSAVARVDDAALRASARFAAMACIILPLLPSGPFGPLDAIRPRELWALVLFFSGLSFAAWLARRVAGPRRGVILSGVLGGLISSTSVTLSFARDSRADGAPRVALGLGAVAACTVMLVRVAVACTVLNLALALMLPRYLVPALAVGVVAILTIGRMDSSAPESDVQADSPLQLQAALQMTALFQMVLFVILAVQSRWSADALMATSVFVGLTDVDALTLSLARSAAPPNALAAVAPALAAGVLANTVLKLAIALVVGRGAFRGVMGATLGAMAAAMLTALLLR